MANESLTRNEEIVDGVYPLGAAIRRSLRGAVYETEFGEGDGGVPAVIKIREVESAEAEVLSRRLGNIAQLAHPNLLKIYASGASTLNDAPVFYVVMERAEESLEGVLAERALTESETREMLVPALEALDYLHKQGYMHSRLRPSNVLAVSDQLKLSTDCVVPLTEGGAAEDMRSLGVLILQALAQKIPNPDERPNLRDFDGIPQPLADIVRRCLDPDPARRWTVEQVKARLDFESDAKLQDAPAIVAEESSRSEEEDPDAGGPMSGVPKWIYAGLAALILIVILVAVSRRKDSAPAAIPVAAASQQDSQALATEPAVAEPVTPAPHSEAPQAAPLPSPRQTASAPGERKASGWSVIVGAYRSRELAEKRVRDMTQRWPNFKIGIFESQGEKAPYLLVLGRNLSEDQAQALQKRAFESRLPGDTYIKRLK